MKWKKIKDGKLTIPQYERELKNVFNEPYRHYETINFKLKKSKCVLYHFYDTHYNRVAVYSKDNENFILNIELKSYILNSIRACCDDYYTFDYGEVFFNPWEKSVCLVGSKKGIGYSSKRISSYNPNVEFDEVFSDPPDLETIITYIADSELLIEAYPEIPQNDDESLWLHVGQMTDINDLKP